MYKFQFNIIRNGWCRFNKMFVCAEAAWKTHCLQFSSTFIRIELPVKHIKLSELFDMYELLLKLITQ